MVSVKYVCRHCRAPLGEIPGDAADEARLGFHFLTPEERRDIIAYNSNGDVSVQLVCDYCSEALRANPELTLVGNPLQ
jgi:hypothetical protein